MDELTTHINVEGFHLCVSKISGYNKDTFNLDDYFAEHHDRDALKKAAARARSAASAARQAQAAAAVASSSFSAFFSATAPTFLYGFGYIFHYFFFLSSSDFYIFWWFCYLFYGCFHLFAFHAVW